MAGHYMEPPVTDCMICERRSQIFRWLSEEEVKKIHSHKQTVRFSPGETIRKQGTTMTHVISINSGMAKLYLEGIKQRNTTIRIIKATAFVGGPGIYFDQLHHFTVTALTDTTVCFIDINVFKDIVAVNRRFSEEFLKEFSGNVVSVYNRLVFLTQKGIPGRMADTLLYLMEEIFGQPSFEMVLTIQDFSELSAMSKDSAYKILKQFESEKIISAGNRMMAIIDPQRLEAISKNG